MRQKSFFTVLLALVLAISSAPYFSAYLNSFHGQHQIFSEIEGVRVNLVLHHDGELSDHHHENGYKKDDSSKIPDSDQEHSDDSSTSGGDHLISQLSEVVEPHSPLESVTAQFYSVVFPTKFFLTLVQASFIKFPRLLSNSDEGIFLSIASSRTAVLLL